MTNSKEAFTVQFLQHMMQASSEKNLKEPSVSDIISRLFLNRIETHQYNTTKESKQLIHHRRHFTETVTREKGANQTKVSQTKVFLK